MKTRHVYLALCVLGVVLPCSQLVPWVAAHGIDLRLLLRDLFGLPLFLYQRQAHLDRIGG